MIQRTTRLAYLTPKLCFPRFWQRNYANFRTPFDVEPDFPNQKYSELNNMYTAMFTGGEIDNSSKPNEAVSVASDIDALNAEIAETYNFAPNTLSGYELGQIVKSPGRFILKSLSNNPFFNLALEEFVFLNTPLADSEPFSSERLLFYVNDKCVVIGKNQNPWKEVNLSNCRKSGYEFVRRRSGGGAVVHDMGNVNYSYFTSRDSFEREYFNRNIVDWLTKDYPDAAIHLNSRGDIQLGNFKVSGSAYKIAKGRAYHHGTMLVKADLALFSGLLKPDYIEGIQWSGGSVESVRSRVKNLNEAGIKETGEFVDLCIKGFKSNVSDEVPVYLVDELTTSNSQILETKTSLESEEWLYNSGPKFTITFDCHEITVEKGRIISSTLSDFVGVLFKDFAVMANEGRINGVTIKI